MRVDHLRRKVTGLVLFSLLATAMFMVFVVKAGVKPPFASDPYEVSLKVPNAATLVGNADVRAAGVLIGAVKAVEPTRDGSAQLRIAIKDDYAPLPRDTRARVQLKTVLGESYLALSPGTGAAGDVPNGGSLAGTNVDDQVQLDEILDAFDHATRKRLKADLSNLGTALDGRGEDLNRTFEGLEPLFADGKPLLAMLARQRGQLARAMGNTSQLFEVLGRRRAGLTTLVRELDRTATAAAGRDRAIAATVRALPRTLAGVRRAADALGTFGDAATPVLADLVTGAQELTPSLRALGPAATSARRLLEGLPALTRRADPMLVALKSFSKAAPQLTAEIPNLACQINPALDYLAPYRKETGAFFSNVSMVNDVVDQIGRNPIMVVASFDANAVRTANNVAPATVEKLLKAGGLGVYKQMQYNPYPKPGDLHDPQPWDGKVPQVAATCPERSTP